MKTKKYNIIAKIGPRLSMTAGDFRLVLKAWYMYALFFYFILLKPKYEIEHIKCVIFLKKRFPNLL